MAILFKRLLLLLLYPFGVLYGSIIAFRNLCYNISIFDRHTTAVFSIGIGNITVGGTGKTPHIEYFIRKYNSVHEIATLSRGYGRKTKGFLHVDASMNSEKVGDEPWQFFLKFGQHINVNVGEKRVHAAKEIAERYPDIDLLLMDDVFQHLAVKPHFSILLCDYTRPFFDDYPFPAGRLREFRRGAKRADTIIVSKCPITISKKERVFFVDKLSTYAKGIPVAFSTFKYSNVVSVFNSSSFIPNHWLLVTGIARPQPLIEHLQSQNALLAHMQYADHHDFSEIESLDVLNAYQKLGDKTAGILITEKDYARLNTVTKELWKELPLFYIPIEVEFIEGEELLLQNIQRAGERKA